LPQAKKRGSEAAARETLLMNNQQTVGRKTIALNKRARFEYHIEERIEAGIALEGWEVKALREGRVQFADSYVLLKDNEAYLFGCLVNPLPTVSTHVTPDPTRTRKLLLHRREIDRLVGAVDRRGYTVVPTAMYWSRGKVKVEIGMARGKRQHDKRKTQKDRDWERQKSRIMKRG
jgi:SsrA-binding protein